MPKSTTPKWAVIGSWKRYSLHAKKGEADEALVAWKAQQEALDRVVVGSKGGGYRSIPPGSEVATRAARVIKLADHPICYIGVREAVVEWLRELEQTENPLFERCSARAKQLSDEWSHVEAV